MFRATGHSLRGIRLLQSLSQAELAGLEQHCRWRRVVAGQRILDRSSDSRDVFFVVEGSVRAVDFSATGREVVYAVIGAGGHFGELSAIDGLARSASVVAIEDCLLAALPPTQFEALIRGQPEIAIGLLRGLVRIIRTTDERLIELTTMGAMARVCQELLRLAQRDERTGAWMIASLPTQKDLAGWAGTTRENSRSNAFSACPRWYRAAHWPNSPHSQPGSARSGHHAPWQPRTVNHPHRAVAWCRRPQSNILIEAATGRVRSRPSGHIRAQSRRWS